MVGKGSRDHLNLEELVEAKAQGWATRARPAVWTVPHAWVRPPPGASGVLLPAALPVNPEAACCWVEVVWFWRHWPWCRRLDCRC